MNKWHHLASKNVKGGLDVSIGENTAGGVGGLGDLNDDEPDNTQDNMYSQLDNTVDLQNSEPLVDTPAVSIFSL